ncbi:phage tail protein [Citrobacter cronae]|uniref:phage tail protein n=1 Tax=Citrobacter cronae TaxID=1748967 RepID=UPI0021D17ECB|nr:phage tail protein [Citrobacter cronae]MCU6182641.1 phage tail protein [Citrobacter cronae]
MAAKFFALLTNVGAAKLSNMAALGEKLEITSLAVGDGGGVSPTPSQAQTKLINERRRAPLNSLSVDEKNDSQIIAEQIIPESAGGWWIREIGLFDADGDLIAIANCPETYKATTEEGSGRTQVIRMLLTVSSTDAVTLKVDPSVVLATRQYVDDAVIEVKSYADKLVAAHEAKVNPHSQYPLIANALKEMADAGLVSEVLKNLRLGEAAKRDVGSGVGQVPDMSNFQSGGGWFKLPSGYVIQAFEASFDSNGLYINFPIPFPSSVIAIVPGVLMSTPASPSQQFPSIQRDVNDLTRFFAKYNIGGMNSSYFIAIGK